MEILHLTIKKKQFDMILSGEKKEEYREVKDYWMKRLAGIQGCGTSYNFTLLCNAENKCKEYDTIFFKNEYSKKAPTIVIECKGIEIKKGKKQQGAPNYKVFVIKLGKIIETRNCDVER